MTSGIHEHFSSSCQSFTEPTRREQASTLRKNLDNLKSLDGETGRREMGRRGAQLLNLTSSMLLLNDVLDYSSPTVQYQDKLDR